MTAWDCIWRIGVCGACGGLVACIHKEAVFLPHFDKVSKAWSPGAIGTITVGIFAAILMWFLYSPSASIGIGTEQAKALSLTFRELGNSLIVGFSGGKFLTLIAQQNAAKITKRGLQNTANAILDAQGK